MSKGLPTLMITYRHLYRSPLAKHCAVGTVALRSFILLDGCPSQAVTSHEIAADAERERRPGIQNKCINISQVRAVVCNVVYKCSMMI